jgi:hypothetical protein
MLTTCFFTAIIAARDARKRVPFELAKLKIHNTSNLNVVDFEVDSTSKSHQVCRFPGLVLMELDATIAMKSPGLEG